MLWSNETTWNLGTLRTTVAILLVIGIGNAKADFVFGEPVNLGPTVNSGSGEWGPSISSDGLQLYFSSFRSGGSGDWDMWISTRITAEDDWGVPTNLGSTVNSNAEDGDQSISSDGLELYFDSERSGGSGGADLWVSKRATTDEPWGAPVNLGSIVNSSSNERYPSISADGLELYFNTNLYWYLYVTRRATKNDPWGPPAVVPGYMIWPDISADGRMILFGAEEAGGFGSNDIWMRRRATTDDDWGPPVNLGSTVNSSSWDCEPSLSRDGRTLYFTSNRGGGIGGWDTWQVPISPVVDFTGDGTVDGKDVLVMAEHWGQNRPSCDIGPTPFGDGTIDLQDLIVLAEYIGKEVNDPTLIAHWALDETEGMVASDSAGQNEAAVVGVPGWRPAGGAVGGALELNGMTFLVAGFVLNPSDGPFSVLAWVKGGAPGQGIITQQSGVNWLMADAVEGTVATEFSPGLCGSGPCGEAAITDGDWHRIGFTWDGSVCLLYIDDVLVAEAAEDGLAASAGKSVIGCGKMMAPGTFFTGLIDDVRIYRRAVKP